ncbi:MAG: aldose 1-epimerase family protein [Mycobacteriales bacterium]
MTSTNGPVPPSGEQYKLAYGELRAVVVEVGGALRDLRLRGRAVLDGYPVEEMCIAAKGQSLLPWPNRVEGGRYRFQGQDYQLALTEVERSNAIHGLVRWMPWSVVDAAADRVVMGVRSHPQPGYPWTLDLRIDYTVAGDGLTVATTAVNRSDSPCPFAAGAHPYLTAGTPTIDDAVLELRAGGYLPTDERGIPTGRKAVAGSPYDFCSPRPIGTTEIDYAFLDLDRDAGGRATLTLSAPDGGASVALWADAAYPYLEVFTADTLPEGSRRTGLGVEPMTGPPNAFATGEDLVVLGPGESWTGTWGITASLRAR